MKKEIKGKLENLTMINDHNKKQMNEKEKNMKMVKLNSKKS